MSWGRDRCRTRGHAESIIGMRSLVYDKACAARSLLNTDMHGREWSTERRATRPLLERWYTETCAVVHSDTLVVEVLIFSALTSGRGTNAVMISKRITSKTRRHKCCECTAFTRFSTTTPSNLLVARRSFDHLRRCMHARGVVRALL